jgi:hypothetical protein
MAFLSLAASAFSQSSVTLGWDASSGATGYNVHYGTTSQSYPNTISAGSATSATITNLTPGTTYYIAVGAYGSLGIEGSYSGEMSYTVPVARPTPPAIVLTPSNGGPYVAPANMTFLANVTTNGHTINSVQFYNGATLLGQDVGPHYGLMWSNIGAGTYSLTARVVYDGSSTVDSIPLSFTVAPAGSAFLKLTVNPSRQAVLSGVGQASSTYLVQASPNLKTWTNIGSLVAAADGSFQFTDPNAATYASRSYRLALSVPWPSADIGGVAVAGSTAQSGVTYTVSGAGKISGNADSFRFVYQSLNGDGEIKAQLTSVQNTGGGGCVGVMIRELMATNSQFGGMTLSTDGHFRWFERIGAGNNVATADSGSGTPPAAWVRVTRSGNTLSGYKSTDGVNWTLVHSSSITMAANIYVGLAVASGDVTKLNTSVFTNVAVVP